MHACTCAHTDTQNNITKETNIKVAEALTSLHSHHIGITSDTKLKSIEEGLTS
jgi:hypothetical protein